MRYCSKCVYPENARPGIIIHDDGVCSGCKHVSSRDDINWDEREKLLINILEEYKNRMKK